MLYSGEGEAGIYGGPSGDLYVVLHCKEHEFFEREGKDLRCVVPISCCAGCAGHGDQSADAGRRAHAEGSRRNADVDDVQDSGTKACRS